MHPDYRSASCDDVARRVDECMLSELVAEAKALCDIDYCFGEADRQAKERRAWVLISKLSRAATPTPLNTVRLTPHQPTGTDR